jgi:hypothetical protein
MAPMFSLLAVESWLTMFLFSGLNPHVWRYRCMLLLLGTCFVLSGIGIYLQYVTGTMPESLTMVRMYALFNILDLLHQCFVVPYVLYDRKVNVMYQSYVRSFRDDPLFESDINQPVPALQELRRITSRLYEFWLYMVGWLTYVLHVCINLILLLMSMHLLDLYHKAWIEYLLVSRFHTPLGLLLLNVAAMAILVLHPGFHLSLSPLFDLLPANPSRDTARFPLTTSSSTDPSTRRNDRQTRPSIVASTAQEVLIQTCIQNTLENGYDTQGRVMHYYRFGVTNLASYGGQEGLAVNGWSSTLQPVWTGTPFSSSVTTMVSESSQTEGVPRPHVSMSASTGETASESHKRVADTLPRPSVPHPVDRIMQSLALEQRVSNLVLDKTIPFTLHDARCTTPLFLLEWNACHPAQTSVLTLSEIIFTLTHADDQVLQGWQQLRVPSRPESSLSLSSPPLTTTTLEQDRKWISNMRTASEYSTRLIQSLSHMEWNVLQATCLVFCSRLSQAIHFTHASSTLPETLQRATAHDVWLTLRFQQWHASCDVHQYALNRRSYPSQAPDTIKLPDLTQVAQSFWNRVFGRTTKEKEDDWMVDWMGDTKTKQVGESGPSLDDNKMVELSLTVEQEESEGEKEDEKKESEGPIHLDIQEPGGELSILQIRKWVKDHLWNALEFPTCRTRLVEALRVHPRQAYFICHEWYSHMCKIHPPMIHWFLPGLQPSQRIHWVTLMNSFFPEMCRQTQEEEMEPQQEGSHKEQGSYKAKWGMSSEEEEEQDMGEEEDMGEEAEMWERNLPEKNGYPATVPTRTNRSSTFNWFMSRAEGGDPKKTKKKRIEPVRLSVFQRVRKSLTRNLHDIGFGGDMNRGYYSKASEGKRRDIRPYLDVTVPPSERQMNQDLVQSIGVLLSLTRHYMPPLVPFDSSSQACSESTLAFHARLDVAHCTHYEMYRGALTRVLQEFQSLKNCPCPEYRFERDLADSLRLVSGFERVQNALALIIEPAQSTDVSFSSLSEDSAPRFDVCRALKRYLSDQWMDLRVFFYSSLGSKGDHRLLLPLTVWVRNKLSGSNLLDFLPEKKTEAKKEETLVYSCGNFCTELMHSTCSKWVTLREANLLSHTLTFLTLLLLGYYVELEWGWDRMRWTRSMLKHHKVPVSGILSRVRGTLDPKSFGAPSVYDARALRLLDKRFKPLYMEPNVFLHQETIPVSNDKLNNYLAQEFASDTRVSSTLEVPEAPALDPLPVVETTTIDPIPLLDTVLDEVPIQDSELDHSLQRADSNEEIRGF